jgi:peroxiredoxin
MTIRPGELAPPVEGIDGEGPRALVFFKVSCPTCQMSAAPLSALATAYPGRVFGVGQDPSAPLAAFARAHGFAIPAVSDPPPYPASDAYGVEHVPTFVVVGGDGIVVDVVESWDRDALNGAVRTLARELDVAAITISEPGDGLPGFRPG